tara:strand:- start:18857 stop:19312 length:456 start_codon:yes stop_codon:yes gene_type:complete
MALDDIKISTSTIPDVYKAVEVVATTIVDGEVKIVVTNYGESDISNLGAWISIAAHQGDVDNPADYSPHIDYQDLLTWGSQSHRSSVDGGLWIYPPGAATGTRVRRGVGATKRSKIPLGGLTAGANLTFTAKMQVPSTEVARRMFVNISVE